jgi:hypothetical protein
MSKKQIITVLTLLSIFVFGSANIAVAQYGNATGSKPTLAVPDTDVYGEEKAASKEPTGECCHTKGVPECGGSCDICCNKDEKASCVAGSCDPNNTFACTCVVTTSCRCN